MELKKEGLTARQLSERLGVEEEKIRRTIQELKKMGLIKEASISSERENSYQFIDEESKIKTAMGFLLIIVIPILNLIAFLLMSLSGFPVFRAFPFL